MILGLLKQLPMALARYLAYRVRLLFRRAPAAPPVAEAEPAASPAKSPVVSQPPDAPEVIAGTRVDITLAESLQEQVKWPALLAAEEEQELLDLPLYQLWRSIPGGHKWSQYFPIYESLFAGLRHRPLKILEIGIYRGSSLRLWREYFDHAETVLVGIDIDPQCAQYLDAKRSLHVMIGDQTDAVFLEQLVTRYGPFDIIIDDGSHLSGHIITSFNHLFQNGLKPNGLYVVEDLHTHYFPDYRNSTLGFIDIAKHLVELMHRHYVEQPTFGAFAKGYQGHVASIDVPRMTTLLQEIRFFDSVVAITKKAQSHPPYAMLMADQAKND